ncbi:MAG: S1 family peptidase, partial [Thermoguttaceae bacterium]
MNRPEKATFFLAFAVAVCATSAAAAQSLPQNRVPNPAIVRIIAPENNGVSFGSGSLVAVNQTYGLVVTNWHVVRDASSTVWVAFPDGFYSPATILKIDRDWDLAALAVWRPNAAPIPLASEAPQPGERLTIAGYGSGWFRATSGRCTQYVSPGKNLPFEMLELSVPARNGDSGGPILNDRGELAGVLFGSGFGQTTGTYCGRLRWFLSSAAV